MSSSEDLDEEAVAALARRTGTKIRRSRRDYDVSSDADEDFKLVCIISRNDRSCIDSLIGRLGKFDGNWKGQFSMVLSISSCKYPIMNFRVLAQKVKRKKASGKGGAKSDKHLPSSG